MVKCDEGFEAGASDNLPKVDSCMIMDFFMKSDGYSIAESRGVKENSSGRESYGDLAIGYVQVKRERDICILKCRVCPEHKVSSKNYAVTLRVDERRESITELECHDCTGSKGGCKHAIAVVMWAHRRSEEPSPTEVECYWKKSRLFKVGSTQEFLTVADFGGKKPAKVDTGFLQIVQQAVAKQLNCQSAICRMFNEPDKLMNLSIHQLLQQFVESGKRSFDEFCVFAASNMLADICKEAEEATVDQHGSTLWHELRYGRVTASVAYDAAHCHIPDGSLINRMTGLMKLRDTKQMERGRRLESLVINHVAMIEALSPKKCRLTLSAEYPYIGATPDAVGNDFIMEVKCPSSAKTLNNYITGKNGITAKCKAQVQMQMFLLKKKKCYFCIADPNFETTKKVRTLVIDYDNQYLITLMHQVQKFWEGYIFPKLYEAACN